MTDNDQLPQGPQPQGPQLPTQAGAGRAAALIAGCAVLGAALVAVAAGLTWWAEDFVDPLTGPVAVTASGSSVVPELVPVALVALAGLGAALATHGMLRRLVGVVLVLGGALIAVRCGLSLGAAPASLAQDLPRPADPVGATRLSPWGPLLGIAGGLLIAVAGGLIVAGRGARRMSSRYEGPGSVAPAARAERAGAAGGRTTEPGRTTESGRTSEPGRTTEDWWKALDAGSDPTQGPDAGADSAAGDR